MLMIPHPLGGSTLVVTSHGFDHPPPAPSRRTSLISSWRSSSVARAFYDSRQSNELDVKLRIPNLGHQLLPKLRDGDPDATGLCSKQHLLKVLLLHFNILLTPGEQDCLIAEWQVMDHLTGEVRAHGLDHGEVLFYLSSKRGCSL